MDIFKIQTTSWDEESFYVETDLSKDQIINVITPIVEKERDDDTGKFWYDNETLVEALKKAYPKAIVEYFVEFETITI